MDENFELLADVDDKLAPLFESEEEYTSFREAFMAEVIPQQEEWMEARRKSEEEAVQRRLR